MNSANVAGGSAPAPSHSTVPEPQSPVVQYPRPESPKLQPVLPQKRPDQPDGAWKVLEVADGSSNPVVWSFGLPALAKIPGHTVLSHLLTNVKVAPDTTESLHANLV